MEKKYFTVREAASYTGISIGTLRMMSRTGVIDSTRPGGKLIFFRKDDLINYLESDKERVNFQNRTPLKINKN